MYKHAVNYNNHILRIMKKLWEHSKETCILLMIHQDEKGNIPLHLACVKGEIGIVREFFKVMNDEDVPDIASRFVPLY